MTTVMNATLPFQVLVVIRITRRFFGSFVKTDLSSKAVQGASLPLEGVHHVECGHGLAAGMLGVGDCITDDILQEHLEHTAGLLVDEARDALDTSPPGQPADGGLGDALDVVPQNLPVPLGASLACRSWNKDVSEWLSKLGQVMCS